MLVLSRNRNEGIVIGRGNSTVVVRVVEVRGDKVRLGIEAPREIPVFREEIAAQPQSQEQIIEVPLDELRATA